MPQSNVSTEKAKTITDFQVAYAATLEAVNSLPTDSNVPMLEAIRKCFTDNLKDSPALLMLCMKASEYIAKEGLNDMSKQATEQTKIAYRRSLTVAHTAGFWTRKQYIDSLKPATTKATTGKRGATASTDYTPLLTELRALALTALRVSKAGKRIEGYESAIGAKLITHIDRLTAETNKPALLDLWTKNATLSGLLIEAQTILTDRASKEAERLASLEAKRIAELADFSDLD